VWLRTVCLMVMSLNLSEAYCCMKTALSSQKSQLDTIKEKHVRFNDYIEIHHYPEHSISHPFCQIHIHGEGLSNVTIQHNKIHLEIKNDQLEGWLHAPQHTLYLQIPEQQNLIHILDRVNLHVKKLKLSRTTNLTLSDRESDVVACKIYQSIYSLRFFVATFQTPFPQDATRAFQSYIKVRKKTQNRLHKFCVHNRGDVVVLRSKEIQR